MPFTIDQFFDVLGRYNSQMWPVATLLWLVTAATIVWWLRAGVCASRLVATLLVVHWAWSGVAFHWVFFVAINPAARLFGALFLFQAVCLAWLGVARPRLRFSPGRSGWQWAGYTLILYSFLYPALSLAGHAWPRVPLFAVPCPTTLLTCGLLLMLENPIPITIAAATVAWTAIGGSAASLFDVRPDFALPVGGLLVLVRAVTRRFRKRSEVTGASAARV